MIIIIMACLRLECGTAVYGDKENKATVGFVSSSYFSSFASCLFGDDSLYIHLSFFLIVSGICQEKNLFFQACLLR